MSHARPPAIVIACARRHLGIALPAQDGFASAATDPDFELLDGSSFRRLEQLEEAAQSMARVVAGQDRSEVTSVPIARSAICPRQLGLRTQSSMPSTQCR